MFTFMQLRLWGWCVITNLVHNTWVAVLLEKFDDLVTISTYNTIGFLANCVDLLAVEKHDVTPGISVV